MLTIISDKRHRIINNPTFFDFKDTYHFMHPTHFKIAPSLMKGANLGLFFRGCIGKHQKLCGYGGKVRLESEGNHGHYTVKISNTDYVINARHLADIKHR